jgi:PIN domain nuclease of toxin-antitoxin system
MSAVVLDTHTVVWYLLRSPNLSSVALSRIKETIANGDLVYVSVISVAEVVYLAEKGKLPIAAIERLVAALSDPDASMLPIPFDINIALTMRHVPRDQVPDMPDRIIAATALHLNLPLITRDHKIRATGIESLW